MRNHYLAGCDPFHQGCTSAAQVALGYAITRGMVFPFPGGGVLLMRRRLYPTTGKWAYCGFARPDETTIQSMPGFGHTASEAYQYTAVSVLGNGFISRLIEPVRIDFGAQGDRIDPPLPMFALHVVAVPLAGGKFEVTWRYDPFGQGAYPKDFQVFGGGTPDTVDYNTPLEDSETGLSAVPYSARTPRYVFTTGAYSDGVPRVFGVRGRNSGDVAELNTYTSISKHARAAAPPAASPVDLTMRRVRG